MADPNLNLFMHGLRNMFDPLTFYRSTYKVTPRDINQVLMGNNYPQKTETFLQPIATNLTNAFDNLEEFCFFFTHLIYESRGLTYTQDPRVTEEEKINCVYNNKYGVEGVSYHGRGWFLITWPENYIEVSWGVGLGNTLYQDPDFILKSKNKTGLCLSTAIWWWRNKIAYDKIVHPNNFGFTTDRLWELHKRDYEGWEDKKMRYRLYVRICEVFKVRRMADF